MLPQTKSAAIVQKIESYYDRNEMAIWDSFVKEKGVSLEFE